MMFRILNAILLLTAVSAFSPAIGPRTMTRATSLRMFSDDNTPKPLESVSAPKSEEERAAKIEEFKKSIVKDMNTGEIREVNWVDPAMAANTAPWKMNWWAYILFGFPAVLLANDFLHFLPKDGPLAFLGKL